MGIKLTANTKTVPYCPSCKTLGTVTRQKGVFVAIECPECHYKWQTLSKICPKCRKPNGYAVEGVCSKCYSDSYKSW